MAESDEAQCRRPSLTTHVHKAREIARKLTEDAHTGLRCSKSREQGKMMSGLRKEIDGLKEDNEKRNLIIAELATEVSAIKESSMTKIYDVTDQNERFMKHVREEISYQSQGISLLRDDMKKEISRSNHGIRVDIANMKHDKEEKLNEVIDMLKTVVENQKTQRYASTSTLDTVDTGFGEATIYEEWEEEAVAQPEDKETRVIKRINDLALTVDTRIHNLVTPLGRYLGLDQQLIKEICRSQTHGKDYRNQLFDVIDAWVQLCKREKKEITMDTFLNALQKTGFRFKGLDFKVGPIPPIDQVIIEKNFPFLAKNMIVSVTLTELRECGLLSPDLVNYILETGSNTERVQRLVEILPILGDRALTDLIDALEKSEQAHIAEVIKRSYPNRFYQWSPPANETQPGAEVDLQSKHDDTHLKQRWKVPIKETEI